MRVFIQIKYGFLLLMLFAVACSGKDKKSGDSDSDTTTRADVDSDSDERPPSSDDSDLGAFDDSESESQLDADDSDIGAVDDSESESEAPVISDTSSDVSHESDSTTADTDTDKNTDSVTEDTGTASDTATQIDDTATATSNDTGSGPDTGTAADSATNIDSDSGSAETVDEFGITMLYPTLLGTTPWTASHWANGNPRSIDGRDPDDPTGWSQMRGSGTLTIDGDGILTMGGNQPRIYINPYEAQEESNPDHFLRDVEITVYYMRIGSDGANWGGLVAGARSGPNGHSSWGDYCDATTYYQRFRHDGRWDWAKELKHSDAGARTQGDLWDGALLPSGQWIGMKYVVYNIDSDAHVKLEAYVDRNSEGVDGGVWEKVGETIDDGGWTSGDISGCTYPEDFIIAEGGGVCFIRNTEIAEARYKWLSVREIDPEGVF